MHFKIFAFFILFLSVFLAYTPQDGGICECNDCADCTNALSDNINCYNEVRLITDISTTTTCINNPNAENKTFDCQFNSITGAFANLTYGISLSTEATNLTIKNCIIKRFFYNVFITNTKNITLRDNNLSEAYAGITITNITSSFFENNIVIKSNYANFFISNSSNNVFVENVIMNYEDTTVGFSLFDSNENLFKNNNLSQLRSAFYLTDSINNVIDSNTIYDLQYGGIILWPNRNENNTISNNTIKNLTGGVYIFQHSNNNLITNNNISDVYYAIYLIGNSNKIQFNNLNNTKRTIYLYTANGNILSNNNISYGEYGIEISNSTRNNLLENNLIYYNEVGIFISDYGSKNNSVINNTVFKNNRGIFIYANSSNITENSVYNNTYGIYLSRNSNCEVSKNKIYDNNYGLNIYDSSKILVKDNLIYNNSGYNLQIDHNSQDSIIFNNTFFGSLYSFLINAYSSGITAHENKCYNSSYCFYIVSGIENNFYNNSISNSTYGIAFLEAKDNNITNNIFFNNSNNIYVRLSAGNNFSDNIISFGKSSIYIRDISENNSFRNNTVYGAESAFYIENSTNITITSDEIFDSKNGIYIENANASLFNVHLYNNTKSFYISTTSSSIEVLLSNVIFDNGVGNFENYTLLSIIDVIEPNTAYSINWTQNESTLPPYFRSFKNKYIKISPELGNILIDSISWHWTDDELIEGSYDENSFELWMYNGSIWKQLNGTPNVLTNTLSITNLNPDSDYGILEYNSSCMEINSSGNYYLKRNIGGALMDVFNVPGISKACILISSSNVIFNCNGFSIINNGISNAAGIVINGSNNLEYDNISILNCNTSQYRYGTYLIYSNNITLINNTISNSQTGFIIHNSNNTFILDLHLFNNSMADLRLNIDTFKPGYLLNASNITIDNPLGNFENYTSINIYDSAGDSTTEEVYLLNWTQNLLPLPSDRVSFAEKSVNILKEGYASIDLISFTWLESELDGYNESNFELWKYNSSGWKILNETPDIIKNRLSLSNLDPSSTYTILQKTENCPIITSSGIHMQTKNYKNAPNAASPLLGATCVKIAASDVIYDCNSYNITNEENTGITFGILVNGSYSNITIKNCPKISNYTNGVYFYYTENSSIENITVYNNSYGIVLNNAANNILLNNSIDSNLDGAIINGAINNTIISNKLHNNVNGGIILQNSVIKNEIKNNVIYNNSIGCHLITTKNNILSSNFIYNNSYGIYSYRSFNNTVLNNSIYKNNDNGAYIVSSTAQFIKNNVSNNEKEGVYVLDSNTTFEDDIFYNNSAATPADLYINFSNPSLKSINLSRVLFLNQQGTKTNYINISLNDENSGSTAYSLSYAYLPAPPPSNYTSFSQK
ncbi:MAG: right-handed parallel beta-helix repeat-containing protein, partial [Candidatus Bilamarchaeaceae archaeon]